MGNIAQTLIDIYFDDVYFFTIILLLNDKHFLVILWIWWISVFNLMNIKQIKRDDEYFII